jgi:hypothetical protein
MTIGEDYDEGNVAYFTPRIDTASQRKVMQEGMRSGVAPEAMLGMSSTPTGAQMSALRSQMSTPQSGVGMRTVPVRNPLTGQKVGTERVSTMNIGSFARTQNPYTGPASAAMGPVNRVLSGNYQYAGPQLNINLEPTSQRQLQERNQFALAANLTPGGRVRTGALNLGGGMGTISAGLESMPSESATIARYGVTGSQLQEVGNRLMAQAAYKRGIQPGPTVIRTVEKTQAPGGSVQQLIPGVAEGNPMAPRGYTPNSALDFYQRALETEAAQLAAQPNTERMVRRQGRMVPVSQTRIPAQGNLLYPR